MKRLNFFIQRLKEAFLPGEISTAVKVLLVLFYASILTVGADLSKEMANGEFDFFSGVLEETNTIDILSILDHFKIDPPLIGAFSLIILFNQDDGLVSIPQNRAPPFSS